MKRLNYNQLVKGDAFHGVWLPVLIMVAFISLRCLLTSNMGLVNETNILPFARQHINLDWIPRDWYLNQPAGYRVPFIAVFGRMADAWGFLTTSIVGRLLGYTALSAALLFLSRRLKLSFPLLMLAIALFLYVNTGTSGAAGAQGTVAREWLFGGIEPKIPAYTCIFFAIGLLLEGRLLGAGLLLGLATSFHTLVGGWAFLTALGWLVLWRRDLLRHWRRVGLTLLTYAVGAAFAYQPVWQQLTTDSPPGRFLPSVVYVFIRTPHHLNPLAWTVGWWIKPLLLLGLLLGSVYGLRRMARSQGQERSPQHLARMGLAAFALVSLIPFVAGVLLAPVDMEGKFLQYYPFRFGDIMLPLTAWLLVCCALEQACEQRRSRPLLMTACLVILSLTCALQAVAFSQQAIALEKFPSKAQRVSSEAKDLGEWIRKRTRQDTIFVTSPVELDNFHWLAERATVAKFKLVPPTAEGIPEWITRLSDLSGSIDPWVNVSRTADNSLAIQRRMIQGYEELTTPQAIALMRKYKARYFLAEQAPQLDLPIAYQNEDYTLYTRPARQKNSVNQSNGATP